MIKFFQRAGPLSIGFILSLSFCYAQEQTVSGTVQGIDGPLYGATVSSGSTTVVTNSRGEFLITLTPGNHILQITHTGYKKISQAINVKTGENLLFNFSMVADEMAGEVVVLGSRAAERSNLFTAVPVDVISSKQLLQTSQTSLTQMLQFTVPSLNASRQLVNEPVTLRGLEPDQLLILVNGKRYPNMAFLNWGGVRGILGRGAVSNDLNSIPFPAIEKIEILRDGASAQYGSDAIAGVINIQLKKSTGNTWAQLHSGQFYRSDGESISAGINRGFAIGKKRPVNMQGFLNFSVAFRFQNPTYRGGEFKGTVYTNNVSMDDSIVRAKNFDRKKVSNAGASKHTGYGLSINGGYPIGKRIELFWTAAMNNRTTIFTSSFTLPKNAMRINPELFPDGFRSRPGNHSSDALSIAGIKGKTKNQWHWEYSSTYGNNTGKYNNESTNNASQFFTLGKNAPTSFYTGSLIYGQLTNSIHLSKNISTKTERRLNLGFGAEWRLEHFRIEEGEEAAWKNYDTTRRKQGGSGGLVFSPYDAVRENRHVAATYFDLESEYVNRFLVSLAGRYEYYNDFGSNIAGKLALRYKLTEKFSLRGSASNGFRAPSLQQRYYSLTRIGVPRNGKFVDQGIFRNNSDVAKALGIPPLYAERAINLGGGFTAVTAQSIRITVDAYWIQIKDRIVLSGVFDRSNWDVDSLLGGLTDVNQVQFFTNAINTRTKGIDIIFSKNLVIEKADLQVMIAANFTQTRLFGQIKAAGSLKADSLNSNTLFGREEKGKLERGQPGDKVILSLHYQTKKVGLLLRNTRFGKSAILSDNMLLNADENFSPKILTDLSLSYSPKKWLTFTAGANNLFDVYPDRLRDYRNTGEGVYIYGQEATSFGFNGGYYFFSTAVSF